jgi:hypothetical protein
VKLSIRTECLAKHKSDVGSWTYGVLKILIGWEVVVPCCANNSDMMDSRTYVVEKMLTLLVVSLMFWLQLCQDG